MQMNPGLQSKSSVHSSISGGGGGGGGDRVHCTHAPHVLHPHRCSHVCGMPVFCETEFGHQPWHWSGGGGDGGGAGATRHSGSSPPPNSSWQYRNVVPAQKGIPAPAGVQSASVKHAAKALRHGGGGGGGGDASGGEGSSGGGGGVGGGGVGGGGNGKGGGGNGEGCDGP